MTRVALDSNILLYAEVEPETVKGKRAAEIIVKTAGDGVIPVQLLGEYLRFIQSRALMLLATAREQVRIYASLFVTPATTEETLQAAADLAAAHGVQMWDAAIAKAAERAGARVLLSEDLQNGRELGGLRMVDPFDLANAIAISALFPT